MQSKCHAVGVDTYFSAIQAAICASHVSTLQLIWLRVYVIGSVAVS